jgi:type VI secretion system protein VasI
MRTSAARASVFLGALVSCERQPDVQYQGRTYEEWYTAASDADYGTKSQAEEALSELAYTNSEVRRALYRDLTSSDPEKSFKASWILRRKSFKGAGLAHLSIEGFRADRDSVRNQKLREAIKKLVIDAEADSATRDSIERGGLGSSGVTSSAWMVSNDTSAMTGARSVALTLLAENEIRNSWRSSTAMLVVRCRENQTSLYVVTGLSAQPEYGLDDQARVRIRFDSLPPQRQVWNESTDDNALFAPAPVALARRLAKATTFRFEFTPFGAGATTARFTVSGLETHLIELARACGWKV